MIHLALRWKEKDTDKRIIMLKGSESRKHAPSHWRTPTSYKPHPHRRSRASPFFRIATRNCFVKKNDARQNKTAERGRGAHRLIVPAVTASDAEPLVLKRTINPDNRKNKKKKLVARLLQRQPLTMAPGKSLADQLAELEDPTPKGMLRDILNVYYIANPSFRL